MRKTIFPGLTLVLVILLAGCNRNSGESQSQSAGEALPDQNVPYKVSMDLAQFHQAALNGELATVKEGIHSGIAVDTVDAEHRTALMLSAYNGHSEIVNYLLQQGARPDLKDNMHRTALMFASTGPFNETVKALLKAGADPDIVDSGEHFTALMFAAAEGQTAVVSTLLKHGADKTMKDIDGDGAYEFALANGHKETAALLK